MFPKACAAGLTMLGGKDIVVTHHGHAVRAHLWPATKRRQSTKARLQKLVIILPGFTEFCEKYAAEAARFHQQGASVLIIDWPGQGRSGHLGSDPLAVHCTDFVHYLDALDLVIAAAGFTACHMTLFGHSMGGHLALRYAMRHKNRVTAVILSAPMMAPPVMPVWLVRLATTLLCWFGLQRVSPPLHRPQPLEAVRHYHPHNVLTRDVHGYEQQFLWFDDVPALRRSGPTIGWVRAAYRSTAHCTLNVDWLRKIDTPVLALIAGDEKVVHPASSTTALRHLPQVQCQSFEGARHELTRELPAVRRQIWQHIDTFLKQKAGW